MENTKLRDECKKKTFEITLDVALQQFKPQESEEYVCSRRKCPPASTHSYIHLQASHHALSTSNLVRSQAQAERVFNLSLRAI